MASNNILYTFSLTVVLLVIFTLNGSFAGECCLSAYQSRTYCPDYCCQYDDWPSGSNLYCCNSMSHRADEIYIDQFCDGPWSTHVYYWVVIIIVGVCLVVVGFIGLLIYCCCRKSRGYRGQVMSANPPPQYPGPPATTVSDSSMGADAYLPPPYAMDPPPYSSVVDTSKLPK